MVFTITSTSQQTRKTNSESPLAEQLVETWMTVWLVVLLLESAWRANRRECYRYWLEIKHMDDVNRVCFVRTFAELKKLSQVKDNDPMGLLIAKRLPLHLNYSKFLTFVQLFQAESADKMFGMEFPEHRGDTAPSDWLRAAGTQRATLCMVVRLTVGHSLVIKERTAIERLSAILKLERTKQE